MSITDELRKYVSGPAKSGISHICENAILNIADRIDAEHRKAEDEWGDKNGDMWLKGYTVCHEELMEGHPVIVADLEKAGWVRLPVDADGVPIHVGDVLTDDAEFKSEGKVMRLMLKDEGWMVGIGCGGWTEPSIHEWHHCHVPTVEDVLREVVTLCHNTWKKESAFHFYDVDDVMESGNIAEYAAKLQLKEGA